MPITRKQFELGIDTKIEEWMKKIHDFLSDHEDEAFTEEELSQYFGLPEQTPRFDATKYRDFETFMKAVSERHTFSVALEKAVELREVEKRTIRGTEYYCLEAETLGF